MAGAARTNPTAKHRHVQNYQQPKQGNVMTAKPENSPPKSKQSPPRSSNGSHSGTSSSGKADSSAKSPISEISSKREIRALDGNRDPADVPPRPAPDLAPTIQIRNVDLGMGAWAMIRNNVQSPMVARQKPSTLGQPIRTGLNTYNVSGLPSKPVQQYDIMIGNGAEKRALVQKIWRSKEMEKQLGAKFLFDGNRLAWSTKKHDRELRFIVDLDAEQGRPARQGGKDNKHRVAIRWTNTIKFETLSAYLSGKISFDKKILDIINLLDHILREYPSSRYTAIKRSFFYQQPTGRFDLGEGIEALKGVYQTMRIVHGGPAGARLSINVDVANGTFWNSGRFIDLVVKFVGAREPRDIFAGTRQGGDKSRMGKELKRLRKLRVETNHRSGHIDEYVIDKFVYINANTHKIGTNGDSVTLVEYFRTKYKYNIKLPELPLVQMTRKNAVLPMELLSVKINQRYPFKLSDRQTQKMITFAVEPPQKRMAAIKSGLGMLEWSKDPVLRSFELQIDNNHSVVESRLLPAPTVKFGQGDANPGTSGRWDLRGKKFLQPNSLPLKTWGVCIISGRRGGKPDKAIIDNFVREFIKTYQSHGGRVENKNPALSLAQGDDVAAWATAVWNAAGNQTQSRPQILVFILPDKDSITYGRIKRSCECRFGVVSQCLQYGQVQKCNGQYMSNVCLKFNAKLGGITCRAIGKSFKGNWGVFREKPTMVIGADVSHAAPGSEAPSMAAITMSMDKLATRYAAVCQTNGHRNEMIMGQTFDQDLKPMLQGWVKNVNNGNMPERVIYMRDGVSEGQYEHVLNQEVHDLKELLKSIPGQKPNQKTEFLVLIAGKRHHVRFFPEKGDRNGNALPGTLVETGVTHPFENDFYLCSHVAIKGTARPVHYQVILNEGNVPNDEIHTMLYEHSYQYIRATTPVSIHSAIYYAHLASNRAVPHDPYWAGSNPSTSDPVKDGGNTQSQAKSGDGSGGSSGSSEKIKPLIEMPNQGGIQYSMWYI